MRGKAPKFSPHKNENFGCEISFLFFFDIGNTKKVIRV